MTSSVLAGINGTQPEGGSAYSVEVPFDWDEQLAEAFLLWLYPHKEVQWTVPLGLGLARLGHKWNIPLLMRHSEGFLVAQAQDARRLNEAPAEEIMVWLELADSCNLEELMPWCGAAVVCNWKKLRLLKRLDGLSKTVLIAILDKVLVGANGLSHSPIVEWGCEHCGSVGMVVCNKKNGCQ